MSDLTTQRKRDIDGLSREMQKKVSFKSSIVKPVCIFHNSGQYSVWTRDYWVNWDYCLINWPWVLNKCVFSTLLFYGQNEGIAQRLARLY